MYGMVKNLRGNIGIAIVIAMIAVLSGISFALVAFRDSAGFRMQLDAVQQFHLLRSEVGRGRLIASHFENIPTPPLHSVLPNRSISVSFGNHRTIYQARTKLDLFEEEGANGYHIRSLITANRGDGSIPGTDNVSPIQKYGENKILSGQTIALFHYFTDVDRHFNDVPGGIVFVSDDIIHGRVHSNTDIYMSRNNWPEFHGLVSTAGRLRVSGGGTDYPRDQIILGPEPGLIENHPRIEFTPNAELVRARGNVMYGGVERDDAIAFVTVEGSNYELLLGEVVTEENPQEWIEGYNKFTIYDSYPPYGPVGQEIGVNKIPKTDTIWTHGASGSLSNNSIFVPMELWISGSFGGRQTWASSHNIYLKDDLTYQNTPVGQRPDGIDSNGEQTLPVNRTDYLGIISEGQIFSQYGHKDPIDSIRYRPNTQDIYMYGAYAAVAESENPWEDGVFTYQYYSPKGSTPPQYWRGEHFDKIDLHMFHYPTTTMNPWPRGLDYPWYNPLWPEPGPILNVPGLPGWTPNPHDAREVHLGPRGTIYIFGSLAQRRRGAVGGAYYQGIWDIDNKISPNTLPTYGARTPERVTHAKAYTTDLRFLRTGPPHYPIVRLEGYDTEELRDLGYLTLRWEFKSPPTNF